MTVGSISVLRSTGRGFESGSHGLVSKVDSSQPGGHEFKPRHWILEGC